LTKYRAALEHNPNITVAADWIAEVEQQRRAIETELGRSPTPRTLTKNEIRALISRRMKVTAALAEADPEDKRAVYAELGVKLTYQPDGTVLAEAGAPQVDACANECVGGGLEP
jgi:site-specific DNA recombinase